MSFVTGNPELDFFEQNPELKYISEFKNLIDDLGNETASKILWSTYLINDPNSKIFRMPKRDKIEEVKSTYFEEYDEKKYEHISKVYSKSCMEKEERLYRIHVEKLDTLTELLEKLDVDNDKEFSKYIRIIDKLPKTWDALEKVRVKMIDKMNKGGLRGKGKRTAREKRSG